MRARLLGGVMVLTVVLICAAGARQSVGPNPHRLTYPGKDWSLEVDLHAFRYMTEDYDEKSRCYTFFASLTKGNKQMPALLKIKMEPEQGIAGITNLSEWARQRLKKVKGFRTTEIKPFEHNRVPVIKYKLEQTISLNPVMTPGSDHLNFSSRVVEAYLVRDDTLITITVGTPTFTGVVSSMAPAYNEEALLTVLDSARLTDTSVPSSSFDHYHLGKTRHLVKDFAGAARSFGAALELERQNRRLAAGQWRDLITRAFDSHSAVGDLARAKEVLEYGISQEVTNGSFHLWLARAHAATGDLDRAVASLENVFRYRKSLPFLSPPNPLSDPAFARFKHDERFRRAVKEMKKLK